MSKRKEILEAASKVIVLNGLNQLTLEAVASEAGVSKGGLLYHFSSKKELIKEMNAQAILRFQAAIEREYLLHKNFSKAYAAATVKELEDPKFLSLNSSLLAALLGEEDLLLQWKTEYEHYKQAFERQEIDPALGLMIRLVCDGLWFSKIFGLAPLNTEQQQEVQDYLNMLLDKEKP